MYHPLITMIMDSILAMGMTTTIMQEAVQGRPVAIPLVSVPSRMMAIIRMVVANQEVAVSPKVETTGVVTVHLAKFRLVRLRSSPPFV